MKVIIKPTKIKGEICAPPSKSYTHRAILLASLAKGQSFIKNCLICDDTLYTLRVCQLLGIKASLEGNTLQVDGSAGYFKINPQRKKIFVGNSGMTMRLATAVASLVKGEVILTGEKRLCQRPMADLLKALQKMQVKAISLKGNGCPPIKIKGGNLNGGEIEISGQVSSQFISALLLVSPFAKKEVIIKIKDSLKSKPYVGITLDMMRKFGVEVKNQNFQKFLIKRNQQYKGRKYEIEGDYSQASYFFAAAAITGSKITVKGLTAHSAQGDKYFLDLLKKMGCEVKRRENKVTVIRKGVLGKIETDLGDYPDISQSLAVVAACAKGKTTIKNIAHLRYKETNRLKATATQLGKMGIRTRTTEDSMTIMGGEPKGTLIKTCNDHRMAMSFAVLGLKAHGETVIDKAEVVSKSYPQFFEDLKKVGARISVSSQDRTKTPPR